MITTRFYLDCRAVSNGPAPLKIVITKNSLRAFVPLPVRLLPKWWDAKRQVIVSHPRQAELNNTILTYKVEVDGILLRMEREGRLQGLRAPAIKDLVMAELHPDEFAPKAPTPRSCFVEFMEGKQGRTREIYQATLNRLDAFRKDFADVSFEDVTPRWLEDFDAFLMRTSPSRNARNIHFRNLRAVFNRAIDDDITSCYPFRKFKIRPEATRKRSMSVEALRKIATASLPEWMCPYRDMFMLSFYLVGINIIDLCHLKAEDYDGGRIDYKRAKTHRLYSIMVEREAGEIIRRYRGHGWLLYMMDGRKDYRSWYCQCQKALPKIREALNGIDDGIVIKELTTYWARHTWATIAAELDVPKDTIAAALGHGGNTVTDIYIDFNQKKVDEANRLVLDYVLYDKR